MFVGVATPQRLSEFGQKNKTFSLLQTVLAACTQAHQPIDRVEAAGRTIIALAAWLSVASFRERCKADHGVAFKSAGATMNSRLWLVLVAFAVAGNFQLLVAATHSRLQAVAWCDSLQVL